MGELTCYYRLGVPNLSEPEHFRSEKKLDSENIRVYTYHRKGKIRKVSEITLIMENKFKEEEGNEK